jgi:phenylacetate-CoA ligase
MPPSEARQTLLLDQRRKLAALLDAVRAGNRFYQSRLPDAGEFDPLRDPLECLPFTTRDEIERDQLEHPPYGTNLTFALERYTRLHQTSGSTGAPLRWLDTPESWEWFKRCWSIGYDAAGVRAEDRIAFAFSFGPFIGFWSAFESAADRGHFCLTAGGMTTSARLRLLLENRATVVCCTPTYALRMAEVAAEERLDLAGSSVRLLIVAGEPGGSIPATRARIEQAWGARVIDHAGMTEMGAWGFEPADSPCGLHVTGSEFITEVVDPKTFAPLADGQVGELVLTNLGRTGSPLIRYRTGDLVRMVHGVDAAGRPYARCEGGILGRTDEMLVIRGNNVFPSMFEGILRAFTEVAEFRLRVDRSAALAELVIEVEPQGAEAGADLGPRVERAVRDRLHFRPVVRVLPPGTLPRFEMKARRLVRG